MKKETKTYLIIGAIVIIIITAIYLIKANGETPKEELAKCIGENSELYVQTGCNACALQEDVFGETYIYLNIIDCTNNRQKCAQAEITRTPTWIIKGEKYPGIRTIELLKEETGC